ncbi:hypothetical protein GW17_00062463 [Ensete ventricosum]|nr:hypothetical protein GW17_00062463 [Ensete ventricosum]
MAAAAAGSSRRRSSTRCTRTRGGGGRPWRPWRRLVAGQDEVAEEEDVEEEGSVEEEKELQPRAPPPSTSCLLHSPHPEEAGHLRHRWYGNCDLLIRREGGREREYYQNDGLRFETPHDREKSAERRPGMEGEKGKKVEVAEVVEEKRSRRFRKICVFCGNQPGRKAIYQEAAIELGSQAAGNAIHPSSVSKERPHPTP